MNRVEIEECMKVFGVATLSDGRLAVSLQQSTKDSLVRIYEGSTVCSTVHKDSNGKNFFTKPQFIVTSGQSISP